MMNSEDPSLTVMNPVRFVHEGLVTLNPAQAGVVLRECRYQRQRDETKAKPHITALAEQMRRGLWLPKTQIDFARVNGRLVLVNGHHRMHAQLAAGVNILWNIVIHDCADEDELAALYWKFDTTLRKRSQANILQGIGLAEQIGVNANVAKATWSSVPIIWAGMRFPRYQIDGQLLPDEIHGLALEFAPEARMAKECLDLAPEHIRRRLLIGSRFAVILATLRHQPVAAQEFWSGLCEDDGLAKGDPRKSLLIDMQSRSGMRGLLAQHMMAAARCWNAFFTRRDLNHVKVTGKQVPLAGTPYTVQA